VSVEPAAQILDGCPLGGQCSATANALEKGNSIREMGIALAKGKSKGKGNSREKGKEEDTGHGGGGRWTFEVPQGLIPNQPAPQYRDDDDPLRRYNSLLKVWAPRAEFNRQHRCEYLCRPLSHQRISNVYNIYHCGL
jgi:hypothetical protein